MNEGEVKRLLEGAQSLRDRALLETGYATGMRVSEVTRLLLTDIDSQRMMIRVEQGKGRKDRYVMLSSSLLVTLREYWRELKPRGFLFPGTEGKALCVSAAQKAFDKARLQAGIRKPVSFHTLRHCAGSRIMPGSAFRSAPYVALGLSSSA
jgi:site-specific recombinase XerD